MKVKDLRALLETVYPDDDVEFFIRTGDEVFRVASAYFVKNSTDKLTPAGVYLNDGEMVN